MNRTPDFPHKMHATHLMKYRNVKQELDGRSFASKLEAAVFTILKSRENAGELDIIQQQDHVYLTSARILYIPDFVCRIRAGEENKLLWIEAKGFQTPEWRIKKRLWKFYGPGILEIYTGSHTRPQLTETIIPIGV